MFKKLYPYEYEDSVFTIDYEKLYNAGFLGVIFDIDNTLVHHGANSTPEVDELFRQIHKIGLKTVLLSNNSVRRIERFLENINSKYIADAGKPDTKGYMEAIRILGVDKDKVVYVGDQIFTDIYGANRCGIASILVKFLRREGETKIGKKRVLEKIILKFYSLNKSCRHRLGNIHKEGGKINAKD